MGAVLLVAAFLAPHLIPVLTPHHTQLIAPGQDLRDSNCVGRKMGWGVKLLGRGAGRFAAPVHLEVRLEGVLLVVAGGVS